LSGSIRRGLTFTFRAAFGALWLVAGCGELLGIEDPPAPSECVKAADCGPGRTCVEWKCVEVCRGGACAGSGGEAGHTVNAGSGGDSAGEGGRAASGGTTSAGGDAGEGVSGRGGESGAGGGASGSGGVGGGAAGVPHAGGEAGEPTAGGSGGDGGGPPVPTGCVPGDSRCFVCEDGRYVADTQCREGACTEASGCINPRSCSGSTTRCGANESCCKSLPVPGGSFLRSCDAYCQACDATPRDHPASVGNFALDAFEVTVSRFRAFVVQYAGVKPEAGSGKNQRNPADVGWRSVWDAFLPDTREELERAISDDPESEDLCGPLGTWTPEPGVNEQKPINCVSFYLAYAFCIWDGGRLPTEAEWNYAATGGEEQRVYPWSFPPESGQIGPQHAIFGQSDDDPTGPADVGQVPAGNGRFGHSDLAGNLAEWVFDDYASCYPTPDQCRDCGYSGVDGLRVLRGGSFVSSDAEVLVQHRLAIDAALSYSGFRCVREL
jgi:sulfatase modifying factor 1